MMTLYIHEAQGHPFWQAGMHRLVLGDKALNIPQMMSDAGVYYEDSTGRHRLYHRPHDPLDNWIITVRDDGIYSAYCSCSSGGGRRPCDAVKILDRREYDSIERVGVPMGEFKPDPMELSMLGPRFHRPI